MLATVRRYLSRVGEFTTEALSFSWQAHPDCARSTQSHSHPFLESTQQAACHDQERRGLSINGSRKSQLRRGRQRLGPGYTLIGLQTYGRPVLRPLQIGKKPDKGNSGSCLMNHGGHRKSSVLREKGTFSRWHGSCFSTEWQTGMIRVSKEVGYGQKGRDSPGRR